MKIIAQGAEAKILLNKNLVTKDRIKKGYRLKILDDKIRKSRTKKETKLMIKANKIINVPLPNQLDQNKLQIPYVKGDKLSLNLNKYPLKKQLSIMKQTGKDIAKLHDNEIIHGDLTTSNMILVDNQKKINDKINNNKIIDDNKISKRKSVLTLNNKCVSKANLTRDGSGGSGGLKIFFIDFGLGFTSHKFEDKAVDLHLLKQALEAKHFQNYKSLWKAVETGYKTSKNSKTVFDRLKAVEKRGRYKH